MQTHVGAMKAATTNKDKHGKDFYTRIKNETGVDPTPGYPISVQLKENK